MAHARGRHSSCRLSPQRPEPLPERIRQAKAPRFVTREVLHLPEPARTLLHACCPCHLARAGLRPVQASVSSSLDEVLAVRTRTKPLVLLLDEAHTLNSEVGYALLNASQKVGRDLPFLLVLAGTPGLPSHLNTMNASFWNRAERRPIGRLDSEATAAAIREPLEGERIAIDRNALERVVRASRGYPYFVQIWGQALWRQVAGPAAPEAGRRLTRAETEAARTDFEREKNSDYLDRYEELENLRLLPVARAVADAFVAQPLLDDAEFESAILAGLRTPGGADGMTKARDAIRDLGYVWRPEATPAWEPGIPSLMDYVRTRPPPPYRNRHRTGCLDFHYHRSDRFDLAAEPATTIDMCGPVLGRSEHPCRRVNPDSPPPASPPRKTGTPPPTPSRSELQAVSCRSRWTCPCAAPGCRSTSAPP